MEKVKKIVTNKWLIVYLLIPYIKPATELTGYLDLIFDILKIINSAFIIGTYAYILRKPSKILIAVFFLQFIFFISTIINNGRIWWGCVQLATILSICALLDMEIQLNKKNALSGFSIALGIMAFLTILTMFIFYPKGMYTVDSSDLEGIWVMPESSNYLWGFDNASIFKFIVTNVILILNSETNRKRLNKIITISMLFLTTGAFIYVKSITAVMACIILLLYYIILAVRKKSLKFLNFRNVIIVVIIIFSILIIFNKNIKILETIAIRTNKVTSMDYRFQIWDNTINEFKKSWVIGYGYEDRVITAEKLRIDHPHNIFLDIVYRGGSVAIVSYIVLLALIYLPIMKEKRTIVSNIISIGMLTFFLVAQMDYYNDQYLLFLLYILAYNVKFFIDKEEENGRE